MATVLCVRVQIKRVYVLRGGAQDHSPSSQQQIDNLSGDDHRVFKLPIKKNWRILQEVGGGGFCNATGRRTDGIIVWTELILWRSFVSSCGIQWISNSVMNLHDATLMVIYSGIAPMSLNYVAPSPQNIHHTLWHFPFMWFHQEEQGRGGRGRDELNDLRLMTPKCHPSLFTPVVWFVLPFYFFLFILLLRLLYLMF